MKKTNNVNLIYPRFLNIVLDISKEFKTATGHSIIIHETFRTPERQEYLYAQGRTEGKDVVTNSKKSIHQLGLAVDVVGDMSPRPGIQGPYEIDWSKFGAIVISKGMVWGGKWGDSVHVEMRGQFTEAQLFEMAEKNGILWVWSKLESYYEKQPSF
jgi:hypothetical protein